MKSIDDQGIEHLKIGEVVDEPADTEVSLRERQRTRAEEVALRISRSFSGKVYYRSEKQSHPGYFTRAYVRHNNAFRSDQDELITDEVISVGGRVAVFEGSERVHITVPYSLRGFSASSSPDCSRSTVSGETVQDQLEILEAADLILDLIEETHGARSA